MSINETEARAKKELEKIGFDVYRMTTELDEVPMNIKNHWSVKRKIRAGELYTLNFLEKGMPDFLAVKNLRNYKFVEVKSKRRRLSPSQIDWMRNWSSTFDTWLMIEQDSCFKIQEQVGTQRNLEWKEVDGNLVLKEK